jgi:hypothetical protein
MYVVRWIECTSKMLETVDRRHDSRSEGHELDHGGEAVGHHARAGQLQHRPDLHTSSASSSSSSSSLSTSFSSPSLSSPSSVIMGAGGGLFSYLVVDPLAELLHGRLRHILNHGRDLETNTHRTTVYHREQRAHQGDTTSATTESDIHDNPGGRSEAVSDNTASVTS